MHWLISEVEKVKPPHRELLHIFSWLEQDLGLNTGYSSEQANHQAANRISSLSGHFLFVKVSFQCAA